MAFCNKTRGTGKKPKTPSPMTTRVVLLFVVLVIVPFFIMAAFVVRIFRDYNITALGTSAMDSMSSVGYQISGGLKSRMESSLFAYYNDVVELLSGEELTESEEKLIEKRLTSNVYSTDGVAAGAIIDRNGKVYGVGNYSGAVSFMEEHQEEVLAAGGRCCWYVMNKMYGRSERDRYILARSLNDEKMQHVGYLRHLLLRRGDTTGEILVNLVTTTQEEYDLTPLVEELLALELEGKIVGILHILNDSLSDVVKSDETRILYGQDFFYEKLLGLEFKITPFSFFQPNSKGAEVLYETVREYIGDIDNQVVFDLFSGTGTIGQVLAPVAKKVIGVEIIAEAVEAAKENAVRNGLSNCKFIAGDVFKVLDEIEEKPDVIVLDPPRDGIHPKALPKILNYGVDKIVYISCKMTSLARDLEMMQLAGYRVEKMTAVDQFCETVHVETVCLLSRKAQ